MKVKYMGSAFTVITSWAAMGSRRRDGLRKHNDPGAGATSLYTRPEDVNRGTSRKYAMRMRNGTIALSATDVANHLSCTHLTGLNLRLARGEVAEPAWENPHLVVLQQRGMEHEKAYVESLRSRGLSILDLSTEPET